MSLFEAIMLFGMVGCIIGMIIPIKYVIKFRRWLRNG